MEKQIQAGKIVEENLPTFVDAMTAKARWEDQERVIISKTSVLGYTFEITGVEGNYKIIKRDAEASYSRYAN